MIYDYGTQIGLDVGYEDTNNSKYRELADANPGQGEPIQNRKAVQITVLCSRTGMRSL
ncbi:MAG: hypothetical protein HQ507_10745 [Candidatus Marinimicrobia bacterium]|nr:hypothetical protein [Candidatus Neomarinimicrobiota bacterium]